MLKQSLGQNKHFFLFSLLLKGIQQTTGVRFGNVKKVKNQPTLLFSIPTVLGVAFIQYFVIQSPHRRTPKRRV
jgi:hypothetical protein